MPRKKASTSVQGLLFDDNPENVETNLRATERSLAVEPSSAMASPTLPITPNPTPLERPDYVSTLMRAGPYDSILTWQWQAAVMPLAATSDYLQSHQFLGYREQAWAEAFGILRRKVYVRKVLAAFDQAQAATGIACEDLIRVFKDSGAIGEILPMSR